MEPTQRSWKASSSYAIWTFGCNWMPSQMIDRKSTIWYHIWKGSTLNCFEPYLTGNPNTEPRWATNLDGFIDELQINFGSWDEQAEAELALEKLTMNDNHKATWFFVEFYRLLALIDYNENALLQRAYTALPKHIKDSLIHFDKLWGQRYWQGHNS